MSYLIWIELIIVFFGKQFRHANVQRKRHNSNVESIKYNHRNKIKRGQSRHRKANRYIANHVYFVSSIQIETKTEQSAQNYHDKLYRNRRYEFIFKIMIYKMLHCVKSNHAQTRHCYCDRIDVLYFLENTYEILEIEKIRSKFPILIILNSITSINLKGSGFSSILTPIRTFN